MSNVLPVLTILICAACFFWLFFMLPAYKTPAFGSQKPSGTVRYVVDGDTLYIDGYEPAVRLWGINAPEKHEHGHTAATSQLKRLVLGKRIKCEVMHTDPHKRTVGRCFLLDGRDVGRLMIQSGHAVEMRRYSKGYYSR